MATSAAQIRAFAGPALLSYGFRPFPVRGTVGRTGRHPMAAYAERSCGCAKRIWADRMACPRACLRVRPRHRRRLSADCGPEPDWTLANRRHAAACPFSDLDRRPRRGFSSLWIGAAMAAAIDLSFLALLGSVIAREIVASKDVRNLKVLAGVAQVLVGNAAFHLETIAGIGDGHGIRLGIAATVLMIMLTGGRIVPSFTRNWLARRGAGRLPVPFNRFDVVVTVTSGVSLAIWVIAPHGVPTPLLALAAFGLNGLRLLRWAGERTPAEPLVLILHLAYALCRSATCCSRWESWRRKSSRRAVRCTAGRRGPSVS